MKSIERLIPKCPRTLLYLCFAFVAVTTACKGGDSDDISGTYVCPVGDRFIFTEHTATYIKAHGVKDEGPYVIIRDKNGDKCVVFSGQSAESGVKMFMKLGSGGETLNLYGIEFKRQKREPHL